MSRLIRHQDIDLASFSRSIKQPKARFGLPDVVRFCVRCGMSNQRPNAAESEYALVAESTKPSLNIDENDVCDACRFWGDKNETIDWDLREKELREICDKYRRDDGRYDCIVPGSGGKDSFRQTYLLKHKYNMHPLTITWAPQMYTEWGRHNLQNWIESGYDNMLITPNGRVRRLLTRLATEKLFHPFQPFVVGQKHLAARVSVEHDIPLVFYGDHAAEWGVPLAESKSAELKQSYFSRHGDADLYLAGTSFADLKEVFGLTKNDLHQYMPVDLDEIKKAGTQLHHLGYYEKWDPQTNYYFAIENSDFKASPERIPGTYQKFAGLDDKVDDFNFFCYFIKFGIGRAATDAAQDARADRIVLEEVKALVRRYDGEFPERFAEEFFKFISVPEDEFPIASEVFEQPNMDREYFDHLCDRFRSPHIWKRENSAWTLRNAVWHDHE